MTFFDIIKSMVKKTTKKNDGKGNKVKDDNNKVSSLSHQSQAKSLMDDTLSSVVGKQVVDQINDSPTYLEEKKQHKKFENRIRKRAKAHIRNVEVVAPHTKSDGTQVKLPLRVMVDPKQTNNLHAQSLWILGALGTLSEVEMDRYFEVMGEEAPVNERISYNLIKGTLKGDERSVAQYWELQKQLAKTPAIKNQINIKVSKPDAVLTQILDNLENDIIDGEEA